MPAVESAELAYAAARDARDRVDVARAKGRVALALTAELQARIRDVATALGAVSDEDTEDDARAVQVMRRWLCEETAAAGRPGDAAQAGDSAEQRSLCELAALSKEILGDFTAAAASVTIDGTSRTRLATLGMLAEEPGPTRRRQMFLALEPTWRSMAGDGSHVAPYPKLVRLSAASWARGHSPADANAAALGLDPGSIEPMLVQILEAWGDANAGRPRVEPWDWWYLHGAADRAVHAAVPVGRLQELASAYCAALGADPRALCVSFDIAARPGRPDIPLAFTTFGGRPGAPHGPGIGPASRPWVFATYTRGGLGELTELIHETGHAIHIAGISTRPAFADWPDSDALTEALAELVALDTAEPGWQLHWLGHSVPEALSLRCRYADVMLDVCWALFEIRMHARPELSPDVLWSELTSRYLAIEPHPDLPWWALRGQLVDLPGYMVNYALAAVLAADLRAAIRAQRGDWVRGDAGWYAWACAHIYRYGLARRSGQVVRDVLGRPPAVAALLQEIGRTRDASGNRH